MNTHTRLWLHALGYPSSSRPLQLQLDSFVATAHFNSVSRLLRLLQVNMLGESEQLVTKLWSNVDYLRHGFTQMGFDIGNSDTPIIPVATCLPTHFYQ